MKYALKLYTSITGQVTNVVKCWDVMNWHEVYTFDYCCGGPAVWQVEFYN